MPLTIRIISADSGSRRNDSGICRAPEPIQVNTVSSMARTPFASGVMPSIVQTARAEPRPDGADPDAERQGDSAAGHRAAHRLRQTAADRRVDDEAGEGEEGNQPEHAVTISAS